MPAIRAIDKLEDILASSENFLQRMHELGQEPHQQKALRRLFSPSEAADMVGRDRTTLARAEPEIGMDLPARNPDNNRRVGYTLEQIQAFRRYFGTLPWRDPATGAPTYPIALEVADRAREKGTAQTTLTILAEPPSPDVVVGDAAVGDVVEGAGGGGGGGGDCSAGRSGPAGLPSLLLLGLGLLLAAARRLQGVRRPS